MRPVPVLFALSIAILAPSAFAADASRLEGAVLVGYQGWFRCPGDGSGSGFTKGHWFLAGPKGPDSLYPGKRRWIVDMLPDVSEMDKSSLCTVPGKTRGGKPIQVFTSFAPATQQTHFRWMREYGIDGALVQRFVKRLPQEYQENDQVLKNIMAAARDNGRVFAIEYDVTDAKGDVFGALKADWQRLKQMGVTKQPGYQMDEGKPVVSLWGLGFGDGRHISDPDTALEIITWFKGQGVRVMGGVPGYWTSLSRDSAKDPRWTKVYAQFDIVQPWAVGRYHSPDGAAQWAQMQYPKDVETTKRNGQKYMPVIFPGLSWKGSHPEARSNEVPRNGGDFLWQQAAAAKKAGAKMIKIAMFDEVNEGTAIFKVVKTQDLVPADGDWVTLDADGKALPSDHYLKVAGRIGDLFP
ncbi:MULTISPECIES: glycoside hydrolase family 71/99-like protein [Asticcacaulis]|uniref:glycoside hydrolase family 71/99-like protein n=1 Tax=Asticcacaulis TaxID=76890 RepID=UPI001AE2C4D7|nr:MULTISPECIES: glycoside hydrolase family 71/99-like protein [Asticcacaulis]MBP2159780.1 hypothetical protein [Asticcacaulis solisilvae]MDR6800825.1 hypothetical protein [Asticcacaulis sp. BE141]